MSPTDQIEFDVDRDIAAIAAALGLPQSKVQAAAQLLDEGNTIPFVARYRKERTGNLDETALRAIEDAIEKLRELIERKNTVLKTIAAQDKLDAALREKILACREKQELEEIYLPYKPKRRTRAAIARERGLEGLAAILKRQVNPGGSRPRSCGRTSIRSARCPTPRRRSAAPATSWPSNGPTTAELRGMVRQAIERGRAGLAGPPRLGGKAQQVRDVLRLPRAAGQSALASLPGHATRRRGRGSAVGDRDRRGTGPPPVDRPAGRQSLVHLPAGIDRDGERLLPNDCCCLLWKRRSWPRRRTPRTRRRSRFSRRTSANCCCSRRPDRGSCWASTRASAPAARWP